MNGFSIANDLIAGTRAVRRTLGISSAAVLSLAVGISGVGAAYLLTDALLLHPLQGLRDPDSLVSIYRGSDEHPEQLARFSYPDYEAYVKLGGGFSSITAFSEFDLIISADGPSRKVQGVVASSNYFQTLGVRPELGSFFSTSAEQAGLLAVLSDSLWHSLFGGDPAVVGRSLLVNEKAVTIVGVAPPAFRGTKKTVTPQLWLPLSTFRQVMTGPFAQLKGQFDRRQQWLEMVGRLSSGTTIEQGQQELQRVATLLAKGYPSTNEHDTAVALAVNRTLYGPENWQKMTRYCLLITTISLVTLAVAFADVLSLLLARGALRRRELGIRRVLGARHSELLRLLGLETLILVVLGGLLGIVLLYVTLPLLERIQFPVDVPLDLAIGPRVLLFVGTVTVLGGLLVSVLASSAAVHSKLSSVVRTQDSMSSRRRYGSPDLLMAFQIALAVSVLIGAALLFQTVRNLKEIAPQYFNQNALIATIDLSASGYKGYQLRLFYDDLVRALENHPRVEAATVVSALPIAGSGLTVNLSVGIPDSPFPTDQIGVRHIMVDNRFFDTLGISPTRGRTFQESDDNSSSGVVVLNEAAAHKLYRGRNPIGSRIYLTPKDGPFTVVGIVPDLPFAELREQPTPVIYLDRGQYDMSFIGKMLAPAMTLIARTKGRPSLIVGDVRQIVKSLDPRLPLTGVTTLRQTLADATAVERQTNVFLSGLGLIALLLSLIGLYSLVTHAVVRRTREIAIRRAIGAHRGDALRLLVKRTGLPFVAGIIGGMAIATWTSRFLQSELYGVPSADPATYAMVGLSVLLISALVAIFAARKALHIGPLAALRDS